MTVELVTGVGRSDHVDSADVRAFNATVLGGGRYILKGCECTVVNSNTVRIEDGEMMLDGAHVRVKGGEEVELQSGSIGLNRSDLIVVRYQRDDEGYEDSPITVIVGTPVEGSASDPSYVDGSILDDDVQVDIPIYRIPIAEMTVGEPELLIDTQASLISKVTEVINDLSGKADTTDVEELLKGKSDTTHKHSAADITSGALSIARGGTGSTSGSAALTALGIKSWLLSNIFKVGYVWVSYTNTSPSSILGGTWTPITGRFPYFNAGTTTGGSNTHTHNLSGTGYAAIITNAQTVRYAYSDNVKWTPNYYLDTGSGSSEGSSSSERTSATNLLGKTSSTSNMPSYQELFAWRRTA
jgi:hypothetical protein